MSIIEAPAEIRSFTFNAVLITQSLFERVMDYSVATGLITSNFDHGRGVKRDYTLKYCLQENYRQEPKKFYIKRSSRAPPKSWWWGRLPGYGPVASLVKPGYSVEMAKALAELDARTPSFETIYRNMMRKSPGDVLRTY